MKNLILILAIALMTVSSALAKDEQTEKIQLPTLQCGMCKKTIEGKLKDLKGLDSINVDVEEKVATVVYDAEVVTLSEIETAISMAGYTANETAADRKAQRKLHDCCQPGAHD